MQVQAITKNVPMSAQKMREVVRQNQAARPASAGGIKDPAQRRARVVYQTLNPPRQREELARHLRPSNRHRGRRGANGPTLNVPTGRSLGPILKRRCHVKIVLSDE